MTALSLTLWKIVFNSAKTIITIFKCQKISGSYFMLMLYLFFMVSSYFLQYYFYLLLIWLILYTLSSRILIHLLLFFYYSSTGPHPVILRILTAGTVLLAVFGESNGMQTLPITAKYKAYSLPDKLLIISHIVISYYLLITFQ